MGRRLYVGGLSYSVDDEGVRELFAPFGTVNFVRVARDLDSGRSEGFGLVEMLTAEEARAAVEALHGSVYEGRTLAVFDGWGPARVTVAPESPAAVEARDQLLAAIGAEARSVAEQVPGQASAQLAELARAYAAVATGTPPHSTGQGNAHLDVSLRSNGNTVPLSIDYVYPNAVVISTPLIVGEQRF
ncbi:RNA recognition motif domain-containing protein [Streptomyces sp. NPDC001591]|uniref:RNA recognition motif domain-containing protein n=1 Tax=Streptomyces sp. NPDC001591 TaxID=3364589 RepID=UPI0036D03C3A